ncbi:DDE superfamily endonuclease [Deinococcus hopiensis KR-140]|uniref:DDE superfamily endonuclease n=1 Tax=Deinococcus hopiensis KR-140 TaxID=695939 RepID=A0A1W1UH89_9DEIO|nr:DDE superfamily endonuclease [Deinococcus hopiensis KR-140]
MPVPHNWQRSFSNFLSPCLKTLDHPKQRACLPRYIRGLLAPLERKSTEPIAEYLGLAYQRLHHFLNVSPWDTDPLERLFAERAQSLCGGQNGVLIIDDTALPKSGEHSVGVAHQYCGALGKLANCQALVTLTLADQRVFAPLGMRLFLPKSWTDDPERCCLAGVPEDLQMYKSKGDLALEELDRVRAQGVTFRIVLADAGYGVSEEFRRALTTRGLTWAGGVVGHQKVFGEHVTVHDPPPKAKGKGRPSKHPVPSEQARPVRDVLHALPPHHWHTVKGGKKSRWLVVRARIADGVEDARGRHLPGELVWVVGEKRRGGEVKYDVTSHPANASKAQIVRDIKARWSCDHPARASQRGIGAGSLRGTVLAGLD